MEPRQQTLDDLRDQVRAILDRASERTDLSDGQLDVLRQLYRLYREILIGEQVELRLGAATADEDLIAAGAIIARWHGVDVESSDWPHSEKPSRARASKQKWAVAPLWSSSTNWSRRPVD